MSDPNPSANSEEEDGPTRISSEANLPATKSGATTEADRPRTSTRSVPSQSTTGSGTGKSPSGKSTRTITSTTSGAVPPKSSGGSPLFPAWVEDVSAKPTKEGSFVIILGKMGIGKSSLASQWPGVFFAVDPTDQGAARLRDRKFIPENTPIVVFDTINKLHALANNFIKQPHRYRTLVIEGLFGLFNMAVPPATIRLEAERTKFEDYGAGIKEILKSEWQVLSGLIAKVTGAGFNVVVTGHTEDKTKNNATGFDYGIEKPSLNDKLWTHIARNAEAVVCLTSVPNLLAKQSGDMLKTKGKVSEVSTYIYLGPVPGNESCKNQWGVKEVVVEAGLSPLESFNKLKQLGLRVQ